jgi:hypothetical protein
VEKESIQRRSDHRHPEGVGGWDGNGRTVPASRSVTLYRKLMGSTEANLTEQDSTVRAQSREYWRKQRPRAVICDAPAKRRTFYLQSEAL